MSSSSASSSNRSIHDAIRRPSVNNKSDEKFTPHVQAHAHTSAEIPNLKDTLKTIMDMPLFKMFQDACLKMSPKYTNYGEKDNK
jgi:hypothetical protein